MYPPSPPLSLYGILRPCLLDQFLSKTPSAAPSAPRTIRPHWPSVRPPPAVPIWPPMVRGASSLRLGLIKDKLDASAAVVALFPEKIINQSPTFGDPIRRQSSHNTARSQPVGDWNPTPVLRGLASQIDERVMLQWARVQGWPKKAAVVQQQTNNKREQRQCESTWGNKSATISYRIASTVVGSPSLSGDTSKFDAQSLPGAWHRIRYGVPPGPAAAFAGCLQPPSCRYVPALLGVVVWKTQPGVLGSQSQPS